MRPMTLWVSQNPKRTSYHSVGGAHRTRRGSRFDFGFQSKFLQNVVVKGQDYPNMYERKKSAEGSTITKLKNAFLTVRIFGVFSVT